MKLYKSSHAVYKTQYHIVWVTKYRRKILTKGVQEYLKIKLHEVKKYRPDWHIVEMGMEEDHVHLHMIIPPKDSVSSVIETMKKNTARELKEEFDFLRKVYWGTNAIWSVGFFVSTVGVNESVIRNYVKMQGSVDAGQAELDL
ncbi:MAG: IS200/IS605 family transposase [Patescibacteria group bacterium]